MTKLIKKEDCTFKAPYIVKEDELVGIPRIVWLQMDKLEVMLQQYLYLKGQPEYQAGPSLKGFERRSAKLADLPYVEMPKTPVSDKRVKEAMAFMKEADACADAAMTNSMLDRFAELVLWCKNDEFIEGDCMLPIDTPELGDPLKLAPEYIRDLLHMIATSPIVFEV